MISEPLLSRLIRKGRASFKLARPHLKRVAAIARHHKKSTSLIGIFLVACLVGYASQDTSERTIITGSTTPNFENAPILGNPHAEVLRGEESLFSKSTKDVIEGQKALESEISKLRDEIKTLKGTGVAPQAQVPNVVEGESLEVKTQPAPITLSESPIKNFALIQSEDSVTTTQSAPSLSRSFSMPREPKKKVGPSVLSFPVQSSGKAYLNSPGIKLPTGSYVKAAILTGVEAPEGKTYPVLLQLDFAHILPNDKRLDLAGCFMIAKATGDLSTERVQMQATKLSCVSRVGGMFEREVNGFIADDMDNSFAVIGRVNGKQDRVAATAFLAGIVSGIGNAIKQAQTTQTTTPFGGSQTTVTGDQAKYIAAGGASEAATMVTQWYLKQAQNLLPTINISSGQNVWVVLQDSVSLPKDYFLQNHPQPKGESDDSIYSQFTRFNR